jgi:hypothetical protein
LSSFREPGGSAFAFRSSPVLATKIRHFDRSRSRIHEQPGGEIRFSKSTSAKPTPRPARTPLNIDPTTCHPERSRSLTFANGAVEGPAFAIVCFKTNFNTTVLR